jgi:hypothetical protein
MSSTAEDAMSSFTWVALTGFFSMTLLGLFDTPASLIDCVGNMLFSGLLDFSLPEIGHPLVERSANRLWDQMCCDPVLHLSYTFKPVSDFPSHEASSCIIFSDAGSLTNPFGTHSLHKEEEEGEVEDAEREVDSHSCLAVLFGKLLQTAA